MTLIVLTGQLNYPAWEALLAQAKNCCSRMAQGFILFDASSITFEVYCQELEHSCGFLKWK